ncbi:MAG: RNA 3'-phosphate cyclase [Planctomycetota bacterium]|mgnify:CR=1 FL=1|nr:MAG: RNA 3'-phosphate cyclase [Planctomycetota bacterium]
MRSAVEIDGAFGEGGGQILRTSLALSALLMRPFVVRNIRAKRKNPGLAAQHLVCVRSMARLVSADIRGAELSSTYLQFTPQSPPPPNSHFDFRIPTAGSVSLLLHALYAPLIFCGAEVTLTGGTHVAWSPPFEHLRYAFLPALSRFGVKAEFSLLRAGFYPRGGGMIRANFRPSDSLNPLRLEKRGEIKALVCRILLANLPDHIARRQEKTLRDALGSHNLRFVHLRPPATGPGNCVSIEIVAEGCYAVFSSLGAKGKPAEEVAREAAFAVERFLASSATVDEHLADQLLLPAALASGETVFLAPHKTAHLETNAYAIRSFLDVDISIEEGATATRIRVKGCGYRAAS